MLQKTAVTVRPLPVRENRFADYARRTFAAALVAAPVLVSTASAQTGELTSENFTGVATKILTYLGYAIAAGVTIVVAVVAAQAGWRFFSKFLKA